MPTKGNMPSPEAREEFQTIALRIRAASSAQRLWDRYLSPQDRERLGGDLETAYRRLGTAGMWAELRGVTPPRAVVEVAKKLGVVRNEDCEWLLREAGEIVEVEEALSRAIAAGDLVLVERPRTAHWSGEKIEIDWNRYGARWEFVWELSRHAKAGQPVDRFTFGESKDLDVVTKQKSRLTEMPEFPVDLGDLIEVVGRGTQQLKLPPAQIRIFQLSVIDTLCEWHP